MTTSARRVAAVLAAADVAETLGTMTGLRRAVTLARRSHPDRGSCPGCPVCAEPGPRPREDDPPDR